MKYVGAPVATDPDLAYLEYVQSIKDADLDSSEIDSAITSDLSGFSAKSYADSQDSLLATQSYVDTKDALRVFLASKDVANGVAGLDATAKVSPNRINVPSTQQFVRGPWSPAAYQSAQNLTTETGLFTVPVTDPGYPYKLIVFAVIDGGVNAASNYPQVLVRQGATNGPIVAQGSGVAESYAAVQTTRIVAAGAYSYSIPTVATRVDCVILGGGAGGQGGSGFTGQGGNAGAFTTKTLIRGTDISGNTITGTIGAGGGGGASGGGNGLSGGATSASATGMTTISAAGGTNSNPFFGGDITGRPATGGVFNNQNYSGGAAQAAGASPGNSPGGGGAGGPASTAAGAGAAGGAWFFAYGSPNTTNGPINVIPINLNTQTVLMGATTLYVRGVRQGSTATVSISANLPSIHVIAVPA